jgi:hypothetical protein
MIHRITTVIAISALFQAIALYPNNAIAKKWAPIVGTVVPPDIAEAPAPASLQTCFATPIAEPWRNATAFTRKLTWKLHYLFDQEFELLGLLKEPFLDQVIEVHSADNYIYRASRGKYFESTSLAKVAFDDIRDALNRKLGQAHGTRKTNNCSEVFWNISEQDISLAYCESRLFVEAKRLVPRVYSAITSPNAIPCE